MGLCTLKTINGILMNTATYLFLCRDSTIHADVK